MDDDVASGKRLLGSYLRTDAPWPDQADEKGRVAADMTHEEMSALKKGDRFQVLLHGTWRTGTFHGTINGADAAMWFAYDYLQQEGRGPICTKIYTGLQFTPEYWNDPKASKVFRWPSEDDLNEELLEKMGAEA